MRSCFDSHLTSSRQPASMPVTFFGIVVPKFGLSLAPTKSQTRLAPTICGQEEIPIPEGQTILFGPVDKPVRHESTNLAIALKDSK